MVSLGEKCLCDVMEKTRESALLRLLGEKSQSRRSLGSMLVLGMRVRGLIIVILIYNVLISV